MKRFAFLSIPMILLVTLAVISEVSVDRIIGRIVQLPVTVFEATTTRVTNTFIDEIEGSLVHDARYCAQEVLNKTNSSSRSFHFESLSQNLKGNISAQGISLASTRKGRKHVVNLGLTTLSRGEKAINVSSPIRMSEKGQLVEVEHQDFTEVFTNDSNGIEQSWIFHGRPVPGQGPLSININVEDPYTPTLISDQSVSISFRGRHQIGYSGLEAVDAKGRDLDVAFSVEGQRISVVVDDKEAEYPILVDPTFTEYLILPSPAAGNGDRFGNAMHVFGDRVLIGALGTDSKGIAYLYKKTGNQLLLEQTFQPGDLQSGDAFGLSVYFDDQVLVIGAPEAAGSVLGAGATYIYEWNGSQWIQSARVVASDGELSDKFGWKVSHSSGNVVVTAIQYDTGVSDIGAAYVFRKVSSSWTEVDLLTPPSGNSLFFGSQVIADENRLFISSDSDPLPSSSGAVFYYEHNGSQYQFVQKVKPAGILSDQHFGPMDVFEDRLVVGAWGNRTTPLRNGLVYIFDYSNGQWVESSNFTSPDVDASEYFGYSVAVFGDDVVVGSRFEDEFGFEAGRAFLFREYNGSWQQVGDFVTSNLDAGDEFGFVVDVIDNFVLIAAHTEDFIAPSSGAVYAYNFDQIQFENQKLLASDGTFDDHLGGSAALDANVVVLSAIFRDTGGVSNSGAAYVYRADPNGTYLEEEILEPAPGDLLVDGWFGYDVEIEGDTAVVSALKDDESGTESGAVFVFKHTGGGNWTLDQKLGASNGAAGDWLGHDLDLNGNVLVAGARKDDTAQGVDSGSVTVWERANSSSPFVEVAYLVPSALQAGEEMGTSVCVDSDVIVAGAPLSSAFSPTAGAAYYFQKVAGTWTYIDRFGASNPGLNYRFGWSVDNEGPMVFVGSYASSAVVATGGVVDVVEEQTGTFVHLQQVIPTDLDPVDWFGFDVQIDENQLIVTSRLDNENGQNAGAAYQFLKNGAGQWVQSKKLLASDGTNDDEFGRNLGVDGTQIVVGSLLDDNSNGVDAGAGYVYGIAVPEFCTDPDFSYPGSMVFGPDASGQDDSPYTVTLACATGTVNVNNVTVRVMSNGIPVGDDVEITVVDLDEFTISSADLLPIVRDEIGFSGQEQMVDIQLLYSYFDGSETQDYVEVIQVDTRDFYAPDLTVPTPQPHKPNELVQFDFILNEMGYGFDPSQSELFLNIDGQSFTMTYDSQTGMYSGSLTTQANASISVSGTLVDLAGNTTVVSEPVGSVVGIPQFTMSYNGSDVTVSVMGSHDIGSGSGGTFGTETVNFTINGQEAQWTYLSAPIGQHAYNIQVEYAALPGCFFTLQGTADVQGAGGFDPGYNAGASDVLPVAGATEFIKYYLWDGTQAVGADPVNLFTGAFTMEITDLRVPGRGLDFVWTRTYDSNSTYVDSELGNTWDSPYLQRLRPLSKRVKSKFIRPGTASFKESLVTAMAIDEGAFVGNMNNDVSVEYIDGRGRLDVYAYSGGTWTAPDHHYKELTHDAPNSEFVLTADGDTEYRFFDFTHATTPGRLKFIRDRFGNEIAFTYNASNQLILITDTYDRDYTVAHDPSTGYITGITDFTTPGRTVTYAYYDDEDAEGSEGDLAGCTSPMVSGHPFGNDFPSGKTTVYTYNKFHADANAQRQITSITDGKGQTYLANEWASTSNTGDLLFRRIIRQVYGNGAFNFHYDDSPSSYGAVQATVLNDREGHVTAIYFNSAGNPLAEEKYTGTANPDSTVTLAGLSGLSASKLRAGDPDAFITTTSYDTRGKPLVTTLPEGNTITNVYLADINAEDEHGKNNPITVTRSVGSHSGGGGADLVTQMDYEDTRQLIKTMIDPKGFTTTYFYDYQESTLGDLNGDGITSGDKGLLVRIVRERVVNGLSASESVLGYQDIIETFQYNDFGQLTLHTTLHETPADNRKVAYKYWAATDGGSNPDPDGSTQTDPPANGSGYLAEVIVDPDTLALTTRYRYDEVGNVTIIRDPRQNETTFLVNELNQVMRITSPVMDDFIGDNSAQYEKVFFYDANDNVEKIWTELENNQGGQLANVAGFANADYFEVEFSYDILDNVTNRRVEASNQPEFDTELNTAYFYDKSENLVRIQYPNLDEDAMEYDERDLLYRSIVGDADGVVAKSITTINYDENGNVLERIHPNPNHRDVYTYDGFDRVKTYLDDGIDTSVAYSYDLNSNVTNRLVSGLKDGQAMTASTLADVTTQFDEINRPYQTDFSIIEHQTGTVLSTAISQIKYDENSLVVKTVNPNGHSSTVAYDGANRTDVMTDAVGNETDYVYDANSNVIQVITSEINADTPGVPDVFTLDYAFDELNRLRRTEDDLSHVTEIQLDSRGLPAEVTDAEDNRIRRQFDGLGRKFLEQREHGSDQFLDLKWLYDSRSRMTRFTDDLLRETHFAFDSHNRLSDRTNADATTRQYAYDTESNLTRLTRENGHFIDFAYDDSNRLTTRTYKDDLEAEQIKDVFEYNGLNALTRVAEETGLFVRDECVYERDSRNLALKTLQTIYDDTTLVTYPQKTFEASYDDYGNPTQMLYHGGRVVNFNNYTDIELLGDITTDGFGVGLELSSYEYHGFGRIASRSFENDHTLTIGYDAIKRIESMEHKTVADGKNHLSFLESYDQVHNRRSEEFSADDQVRDDARVWDYDDHYRVRGFIRDLDPAVLSAALTDFDANVSPTDGLDYELNGHDTANNLTSLTQGSGSVQTVANNNMNETTDIPGEKQFMTYDDLGRLTEYYEVSGWFNRQIRLIWNARDQLTRVETNPGWNDEFDWVPLAEYSYGPDGMRLSKMTWRRESVHPLEEVPGELVTKWENYYGLNLMVHEVYDVDPVSEIEALEPKQEWIYEGMDRPLTMFSDQDNDVATGALGGREAYFYHVNPRGDVYALSDEAGDIVERYDYSLYGSTVVEVGYDTQNAVFSGTISDVYFDVYHGSNNYGQIEHTGATLGFLRNELVGHYVGFTLGGITKYFKIIANETFPNGANFNNILVFEEDLVTLGVMINDSYTIVPPQDLPRADTTVQNFSGTVDNRSSANGLSCIEDDNATTEIPTDSVIGQFVRIQINGTFREYRIVDNIAVANGPNWNNKLYVIGSGNEIFDLTQAGVTTFTVHPAKEGISTEHSITDQLGMFEAYGGVPGHTQIDDYDGTIDWGDGECVGWAIEIEVNQIPRRFELIGNFTKRTPDPLVMYNGWAVAEDLAALGVPQSARYRIYKIRRTVFNQPHQWGGAWKDDETCFMWMRHRYYDARHRGFLSRDPAEDDVLGNLYAFGGNNPGTMTDPLGLATWHEIIEEYEKIHGVNLIQQFAMRGIQVYISKDGRTLTINNEKLGIETSHSVDADDPNYEFYKLVELLIENAKMSDGPRLNMAKILGGNTELSDKLVEMYWYSLGDYMLSETEAMSLKPLIYLALTSDTDEKGDLKSSGFFEDLEAKCCKSEWTTFSGKYQLYSQTFVNGTLGGFTTYATVTGRCRKIEGVVEYELTVTYSLFDIYDFDPDNKQRTGWGERATELMDKYGEGTGFKVTSPEFKVEIRGKSSEKGALLPMPGKETPKTAPGGDTYRPAERGEVALGSKVMK